MIAEFQQQSSFTKYEEMLRPFAYNLTKSIEATEDLLQETFYRALANQDKFSEGTSIKAWLFTIMRNIFINDYRRKKKHNTVTDGSDDQYLLNNPKQISKNAAEGSFIAEDISKAMHSVSKDLTEPFMMHSNGFQYQEIAAHLGIPLGTVKSRIFFARKELQSKLKGMGVTNSQLN